MENNIVGLQSIRNEIENDLSLHLKLLILFYADDTVIMGDLQNALNEFYIYCTRWKLSVNVNKTKLMVFSKGATWKKTFYYKGEVIENVKEFKYLGIVISRTGLFTKAKKSICVNRLKKPCTVKKK